MKQQVLVVYEDLRVCRQIRDTLNEQFELDIYTSINAEKALDRFLNQHYDVVIMGILLPDIDGLTMLATMRRAKNTPILVLTEHTGSDVVTQAMNLGADTYFDVPFKADQLLAQVQALIRRSLELSASRGKATLSFDMGLIIDPHYRTVMVKGKELHFTRMQFDILYLLAKAPNRVCTMEQIYGSVWNENNYYRAEDVIKFHISNIRCKLDPHRVGCIESVRGVGYRFRPDAGR